MLKVIIRHEWRLLQADRTAWLVIFLFALLIGYAFLNGSVWARKQQAGITQYLVKSEAQLNSYRQQAAEIEARIVRGEVKEGRIPSAPRHPYQISTFAGLSATLPLAPLAPLVVGEGDLYPSAYRVGLQAETEEQIENPLKLLVGRFDLAYVMLFLYPLLICALSFNLLAAEREDGTLGLLLAQPLRLRTLVVGKVAIRALLVFGAVIAFSLLGVCFSPLRLTSGDVWGRLLVWLAAVFGYGLFWFSLALMVNALGRSAATNAQYPVTWTVCTPAGRHTVRALFDAQELDSRGGTGAVYWEGLAELLDDAGRRVGLGYLEMTGYAAAIKLG